jgi:glutamate formiminotransferase
VLECVVNISEGVRNEVVTSLAAAAGAVLDIHVDSDHHRAVITIAGDAGVRRLTERALALLDLRGHTGVHPRLGVVDVVPFVPLAGTPFDDAIAARDRFARWVASTFDIPCFLYGPERSLPEVRRTAFRGLDPDVGPSHPHPAAGAICVGARPQLVAYNVWLEHDLDTARAIAAAVRSPAIRALGLLVRGGTQVSMNLVRPFDVGPAAAFDAVSAHAQGGRAELVGLAPAAVLRDIPRNRWAALDLAPERTVEARLARLGQAELRRAT